MPLSKRFKKIAKHLLLRIQFPVKLTKFGNLVSISKKLPSCEACFLEEGIAATAKYPDENGSNKKLCAKHAKRHGTHFVRYPCRDCPEYAKLQSNYPDEFGKPNTLCSKHSYEVGSHIVRDPCRDCPIDAKVQACYPDEFGNLNILCGPHAKEVGSHIVHDPCRDCPIGEKLESNYPDEFGHLNILCMTHAKLANSFIVRNPCRDCPLGDKLQAAYPDEYGNLRILCSKHADIVGSYIVLNPCRDCPIEEKLDSSFSDEFGNLNRLCSKHAYLLGLIPKPINGCSRVSCEVWDKLEKELGITLQHAHYSTSCDTPSMQDEYKIPNTNYRVDAFDKENNVIYEYHGNHVHGYPPGHSKFNDVSNFTKKLNSEMYEKTMNRMKFISEITHFKVKFIWGHEYDKIRKTTQPLMNIIHEYQDE